MVLVLFYTILTPSQKMRWGFVINLKKGGNKNEKKY